MRQSCYFSVCNDNIQWFSTLVLNHNGVSNLSRLVAHNFYFFGGFSNLGILNVFLRLRCGFNYKGIGSCKKRKYFSDLNYVTEGKVRRTILDKPSDAVKLSEEYKERKISYFLGVRECCFMEEPLNNSDYKISRFSVLPNINLERDEYYSKKRESRFSEIEISDTGSDFSHCSDKNITLELPRLSNNDVPDFSLKPLTESEEDILSFNGNWVEENKESIIKEYQQLKIKEFEYMDINHFNLPFLVKDHFLDIMNDGEEIKQASDKFFRFLYGVRIFESPEKIGEIKEFGEAMRYILRRTSEICGIDWVSVSPTEKGIHLKLLEKLEAINEIAKEKILFAVNSSDFNVESLKEDLDVLYFERCLIMIEIRSLYTKYAYIQDCYLARKTDYQLDFDFCGFIREVRIKINIDYEMSQTDENRKGLTKYEAGFSPSINEIKEKGRKRYTLKEAREVASRQIAYQEKRYEEVVEHSNAIMGKEWTDQFLEDYTSESIKQEDQHFTKLKSEYNCLIKLKSRWTEDDTNYFHILLQSIFQHDEDFIKYLPKVHKENMSERLAEISRHYSFINSMCTNHPNYQSNKVSILNKNRPEAVRTKSPLEGFLKIINEVTGLDDDLKEGTIKGGVKIMEEKEESEFEKKRKRNLWLNSKSSAIDHVNNLVESFTAIYHYLGDAIELTPSQLGLSPANCKCDNKKKYHLNTYKNTLLKGLNKYSSRKIDIADKKADLENRERELKSLKTKKEMYENSVKFNKEVEKKREETLKDKSPSAWEIPKITEKRQNNSTKLVGLEVTNRFKCLYEVEEEVRDAENLADKFLSVSENLNIIFNWKEYKAKNKFIKKKLMEMSEEEKMNPDVLNKIKTNNGLSPLRKYNVKNIRDVLVIIQLCYNKKIYPDFKYLKEEFGIKRCQSKYLLVGLNILMKKLKDEENKKITIKGKRAE